MTDSYLPKTLKKCVEGGLLAVLKEEEAAHGIGDRSSNVWLHNEKGKTRKIDDDTFSSAAFQQCPIYLLENWQDVTNKVFHMVNCIY